METFYYFLSSSPVAGDTTEVLKGTGQCLNKDSYFRSIDKNHKVCVKFKFNGFTNSDKDKLNFCDLNSMDSEENCRKCLASGNIPG